MKIINNSIVNLAQITLTKPDEDKLRTIYTKVAEDNWIVVYELPEHDKEFCPCCGKHVDHYNIFDGYLCNGYECIDNHTLVQRLIRYVRQYKTFSLISSKIMKELPHENANALKAYVLDYIDSNDKTNNNGGTINA